MKARTVPLSLAAVSAALSLVAAACSKPLPEEGSPQAELYKTVCGGCHPIHQPMAMTATMWKLQIDRMDPKYRAVGRPVPTPAEKAQILDYLTRHAGG